MNIIDRIRSLFQNKTMTADQWKRGMILSDFGLGEGVRIPYAESTIVYVASSRIAQNLPQAPLEFYSYSTKEKLGIDQPLVRLFRKPNQSHTYYTFFEELTLYLALYGETFIWAGKSAGQMAGTSTLPGLLQVLNPTRMQDVVNNGNLVGWLYDTGKERIALTLDEVYQIKFPNPYNGVRGLAPVDSVKPDVDSDFLASRYARAFFQNSANPGLVFTLPEDDESSKEQRDEFMKEWNQLRRGSTKFAKTALLNPGMGIQKVGLTQEEMDYIKQRQFSAERILAVYGVPPPMAGFYEQATYGNVRTAKKIFWNETIKTYARRYESMLNNFFLPTYASGIYCKFNFSDIDELKHDAKETADLVNIYANHGVPMNALIEAFELPFDPQEGLDIGYQNMTMLPVGTNFIQEQQQATNSNGDDSKSAVNTVPSIFNDFEKQLHNYLYRQREKVLKYKSKNQELDESFWKQENNRLLEKFDPIYKEFNQNIHDLVKINNFNKKLVENKSSDEIREIYNKFDKKLGKQTKSRVSAIAEQEVSKFLEQNDIGRS